MRDCARDAPSPGAPREDERGPGRADEAGPAPTFQATDWRERLALGWSAAISPSTLVMVTP